MIAKTPFNKSFYSEKNMNCIESALKNHSLSGNGYYSKKCCEWIEQNTGCLKAVILGSCTAALEVSALLLDLQAGDEIIMPSYTFVSTANAFVLRGAKPVFVDIKPDTLNINEDYIEGAITEKTKAIVPVHYAGVGCSMDKIMDIARKHNLVVIEDAAHGIMSSYQNKHLGTIGNLGTLSFHETKNISCGEGGALLINDEKFIEKAEIIIEKGTNRKDFSRGFADKYTWVDLGSSFMPSDLICAYLYSQLEFADILTKTRIKQWFFYHNSFELLEKSGMVKSPVTNTISGFNAHIYYLLFEDQVIRDQFISYMKGKNINVVFHYVPLHSSPAGLKFSRTHGDMSVTDKISSTIVRLPLYNDLGEDTQNYIINCTYDFFEAKT